MAIFSRDLKKSEGAKKSKHWQNCL